MTPSTEQMLKDLRPLLERDLQPARLEWTAPLGDNWLASWNWARKLERDYGINTQVALRFVVEHVMPKDLAPSGENR